MTAPANAVKSPAQIRISKKFRWMPGSVAAGAVDEDVHVGLEEPAGAEPAECV